MKRRLSLFLGLALALAPRAAAAALPEAEVDALFKQGLEAFDAGRHADAISPWSRLVEQGDANKVWRVLYNLGLAHEAQGQRARALERFEAFARAVGEQPGSLPIEFEGRRQDAVERANRLRPEVAMLRVLPSKNGERVAVRISGGKPRDAGFATYLEPGDYRLEMGEGTRMKSRELTLAKGELLTIVAEQLPPPPPPPPPPYRPPIPVEAVISSGAVTVASLGLPLGMYFRAQGLRANAEAVLPEDPAYPAALEEFSAARTAYFATWAVPAALGATTLALLIVDVVDASTDASTTVRIGTRGVDVEVGW